MEWKSNSEIEEEGKKAAAEIAKKEAERQRKIEEIKASTDPSMEEKGKVKFLGPRLYRGKPVVSPTGIVEQVEYQMEITRREMMLAELGAFDLYNEYDRRETEHRNKIVSRIRAGDPLLIRGIGESWQTLRNSDGYFVTVRLTEQENALFHCDALTQEEIDKICRRETRIISFSRIKRAIKKFHERIENKGER